MTRCVQPMSSAVMINKAGTFLMEVASRALAETRRFQALKASIFLSFCVSTRGHQNCVAHSVHKLFVGGRDCRQRPAQFYPILFHKIIRTKPYTALHCFQFTWIPVPRSMFQQPAPMEA